jgi:pyruvate,water dikinase
LQPPAVLGPDEAPPPLSVMPEAQAKVLAAVEAIMTNLGSNAAHEAMQGTGVGTGTYTGRARIARCPEDAIAALEPGDVLVAANTTPAYNVIFPLAGAVVVEQGGALSHAAVIARELGIPAVVGAAGALREIPDGAEVEVDASTGRVRVLSLPS